MLNEKELIKNAYLEYHRGGKIDNLIRTAYEVKSGVASKILMPVTGAHIEDYLATEVKELALTPYKLRNFKIPIGEPTIVAGLSSAGKTSLMRWMMIDLECSYPDYQFMYLPFEGIAEKFAIHALLDAYNWREYRIGGRGAVIEDGKTKCDLIHKADFIRNAHGDAKKRKTVADLYDEYSERIIVCRERYKIEMLPSVISRAMETHKNLKCIFIDYVQLINFANPPKDAQTRQLILQRIMQDIIEMAVMYDVAIVVGAQFNNPPMNKLFKSAVVHPDNVRDAKDIYHASNTFVGIWNESSFNFDFRSEKIKTPYHEVEIDLLKNRDGIKERDITFNFWAKYGLFADTARLSNDKAEEVF